MKLENDTKSVENSQRGDDNPKTKGWHRMEKSKVDSKKLPILGLFESLNFQFHEPWHGFLKPLRRPANMTRNKSFEKYLILVYYAFFFPLFSSSDFVYCKIQR